MTHFGIWFTIPTDVLSSFKNENKHIKIHLWPLLCGYQRMIYRSKLPNNTNQDKYLMQNWELAIFSVNIFFFKKKKQPPHKAMASAMGLAIICHASLSLSRNEMHICYQHRYQNFTIHRSARHSQ